MLKVIKNLRIKERLKLSKTLIKYVRKFVEEKVKLFEEANPTTFVAEPQDPSMFHKPKYTSMKQIKKDNHMNARISIGLLPEENDIKITNKDPGLNYVKNPRHKTYKDIKEEFRKESQEQFNKLGQFNYKG